MASSAAKEPSADLRNWAELPWDVLSVIFEKLGAFEVLLTAQAVCRPWWRLSLEPRTWRCVDLVRGALYLYAHYDWKKMAEAVAEDMSYVSVRGPIYGKYDWEKMAKAAVDRSSGQMEKFHVMGIENDEVLKYISDRTTVLRYLCLQSCNVSDDVLVDLAMKSPMLQELEVSYCPFTKKAYESVGRCCPQLKCFSLNYSPHKYRYVDFDDEALAIAQNMTELRKLQLFGNKLTNAGLLAIIDGCPNLVFLDLRECFNVDLGVDPVLKKRCEGIKDLKHPCDLISVTEYLLYNAFIDDSESDEEDCSFEYVDDYDGYLSDYHF